MRKLLIVLLLLSVCLVAFIPPMYVRGDDDQTTTTSEQETTTESQATTTTILTSSTIETSSTTAVTSQSTLSESSGEFIIKVDPPHHTIHANGRIRTATYAVTVKALAGFRGVVELAVEGLPESAQFMFNPEEGIPKPVFLSILKISVDSSTPPNVYTITVTGSSANTAHQATTTLVVEGEATVTTAPHEKKLRLTISTNHENYRKGDKVLIFGFVKTRHGGSITSATVSLSVVDPLGKDIHIKSIVTDRSGRFSDNFTLPTDAMEGTYAVYAAADMATYRYGFAGTTFTVGLSNTPSVRIVNATITLVNGTLASEFHPGETFLVWVAVNNSGAVLTDGRVWVEVLDSNNVPVTVVVVVVTIGIGEQIKTGIQVALKTDAPTGTYTIRCLVSNAPITMGGRFLDMKETGLIVT